MVVGGKVTEIIGLSVTLVSKSDKFPDAWVTDPPLIVYFENVIYTVRPLSPALMKISDFDLFGEHNIIKQMYLDE